MVTTEKNLFYNAFLKIHNEHRRNSGLPQLVWDNALQKFTLKDWLTNTADIMSMDKLLNIPKKWEKKYMHRGKHSCSWIWKTYVAFAYNGWYEKISNCLYNIKHRGKGCSAGHAVQMMSSEVKKIGWCLYWDGPTRLYGSFPHALLRHV